MSSWPRKPIPCQPGYNNCAGSQPPGAQMTPTYDAASDRFVVTFDEAVNVDSLSWEMGPGGPGATSAFVVESPTVIYIDDPAAVFGSECMQMIELEALDADSAVIASWSGSLFIACPDPLANITLSYDGGTDTMTVAFDQDIAAAVDLLAFSGTRNGGAYTSTSHTPVDWTVAGPDTIAFSPLTDALNGVAPGDEVVIDFVDAQIGPDTVAVQQVAVPLVLTAP